MIYSIYISFQAELDLRNIYEYIAFNLQSPIIASNQIKRLEAGINSLEYMPFRYGLYNYKLSNNKETHYMNIDNYIILYIPKESDKTVTIIRIVYSGRDIKC